MATQKELHELIGRAMLDDEFRAQLAADPAKAAAETGCELTEDQAAALKGTDLKTESEGLGERLSKYAAYYARCY